MAVEAVGVNTPVQTPQKKTGGTGKAVASGLIPGLGQFLDGRNAAGTGFLLGSAGLGFAGYAVGQHAFNVMTDASTALFNAEIEARLGAKIPDGPFEDIFERAEKARDAAVNSSPKVAKAKEALKAAEKSFKKYGIGAAIAMLVATGLYIYNIVDAYKGKKEA